MQQLLYTEFVTKKEKPKCLKPTWSCTFHLWTHVLFFFLPLYAAIAIYTKHLFPKKSTNLKMFEKSHYEVLSVFSTHTKKINFWLLCKIK